MDILEPFQLDAVNSMRNGFILCGGVGSGKSRTGLAYFNKVCGGSAVPFKELTDPRPLYIITTARKRDKEEWVSELALFHLSIDKELSVKNVEVTVESWNNIQKFKDVTGAFFIFDEQRVVGSGAWVKAFLKIAKNNDWILMTATPGDCWSDYGPVFVANGFFKNLTDFRTQHIKYSRYTSYPKIEGYYDTYKLERLKSRILIQMKFDRQTVAHDMDIYLDYDILKYKTIMRERWNPYKNEPVENASELCQLLRKVCSESPIRLLKLLDILKERKKIIVFYNFDYELESIKEFDWSGYLDESFELAEWNGHKHQDIPHSEYWLYLVQYNAGNEGWNCISTDTMIFYSENYSYKIMVQAKGRIDRMNTPFTDLYYYHFKTRSSIDLAIAKALLAKKKFNETKFIKM